MAVYGNECGGAGFLLLRNDGVVLGEYSSPVDIAETYIGEPYVTHVDMGILGGRRGWKTQIRRGDGVVLSEYTTRDKQLTVTFTPPATELGQWTTTWDAANVWFGSWVSNPGGTGYSTIQRYAYTITSI
jgi:hypothetical protein